MLYDYISADDIAEKLKKAQQFVEDSEALYTSRLVAAAEQIYQERNTKPIVLLSGPSGSGKTTTAFRIAKILEEKGVTAHTVSMDNYFLPCDADNLPLDENGELDLESPYRLDLSLFNEHLKNLWMGIPVAVPMFHFTTQTRTVKETIKRACDEIIIFEGIHALNPLVTGEVMDITNRIYVTVRTRISADGIILHPENIRLLRRLNRDRLFRGRKSEDIFAMLQKVSKGEQKYILPFRASANINIDAFMEYEIAVYKTVLMPELEASADVLKDYADYSVLMRILKKIPELDVSYVPQNSLIREFVGGSTFVY